MGLYYRRSFRAGPIRFNFSKSGIGVSAGIRGLRVGARPDGRVYLHAGRGGVYFRQELGRFGEAFVLPFAPEPNQTARPVQPTERFECAAAANLRSSGHSLVELLKQAKSGVRWDAVYILVYLPLIAGLVWFGLTNGVAGILLSALLIACTTAAAFGVSKWEVRRRSIYLDYQMQQPAQAAFEHIVRAVNQLAGCSFIWRVASARQLDDLAERKRQAGATGLQDRQVVAVGSGAPSWLTSNVPLPTLRRFGQTLYFLPDGVLVEDYSGLAHVTWGSLLLGASSERFIEDRAAPHDAIVEDYAWLHPNKDGSPDARFADNRQLPVCRYGIVRLASQGGLDLYLQTSRLAAAEAFVAGVNAGQANPEDLDSCISVDEVFCETPREALSRTGRTMVTAVDELFRTIAGRGNDLIHGFLWVLFGAWILGSALMLLLRAAVTIWH